MNLDDESLSHRLTELYSSMQRGLVYPSPFARFLLITLNDSRALTRQGLGEISTRVRKMIHESCGSANTTAVFGVSLGVVGDWCDDNFNVPKGIKFRCPTSEGLSSKVFDRSGGTFVDSSADLLIHLKSDNSEHVDRVSEFLKAEVLGKMIKSVDEEYCNSRPTSEAPGGKVLGCRFAENLNNPADPITIANHTLVGWDDPDHLGASFALAQRFRISWKQLHNMTEEQIEDIIGRDAQDVILPSRDSRSHIKASRVRDKDGNTQFLLRLGLPFGHSDLITDPEFARRGSNLRDEEGIFFAGFAKSAGVLESLMSSQIGEEKGFMRDRLLSHVRSDFGGVFYMPSRLDLCMKKEVWGKGRSRSWNRFPGVNWSRLSRHFDEKSPNGKMYYNHKNYLYEMAASSARKGGLKPPSKRVLTLMMDLFSRWQDTWYFPKNQTEMGHLCEHLGKVVSPRKIGELMGGSIMIRKGWATRITCQLYADPEYGRTPRRFFDDPDNPGHSVGLKGADTYRIHPMDLIVGSMPDLSLAQGRFVLEYLSKEEQLPSYFCGITEASGVGHVLPDHQSLVNKGLGRLLKELEGHQAECQGNGKAARKRRDFYAACILSLQGIQDHLQSFADLALEKASEMHPDGQAAEKKNLEQISERLSRLTTKAPKSMLEAAQLIFTLHSCLHMNGEPVSVGRLDQYLGPFCERDLASKKITEVEAQEIIDSFWIKIDEKVLQNRLFIQDHQPYGNLAMGGASGPYPQGASLGQWLMQVTVGGVGKDGKSASNLVTKLCLRASARLPLHAPCLSLRVFKGMDRSLLKEAAKAILSGGAHPILLNDDKIIPGLQKSGDGVGGPKRKLKAGMPSVAEQAEGKWRSKVSIESARNYACDGCYEPMFTGQNWFSLGGFSTLDPLECALNQGRLYASAGPAFLRGQNHSFRSAAPEDIKSFDELVELYLKHFYWLIAKSLDGQLRTFDNLALWCPAPLLSVFTDDCLAKGLDIYEGGARYNVYAPCFIGLSSTINALYNIDQLVFNPSTAVTSLPELVDCLICNWGHKMEEPFVSSLTGSVRASGLAERWKRGRELALAQPKYGRGHPELDAFGDWLIKRVCEETMRVFRSPLESTAEQMLSYAKKYGTLEHPFGGFQLQPGVGTFENFVAFGKGSGASADGRCLGDPIASDLSAAPDPADREPSRIMVEFQKSLEGFSGKGAAEFTDGAPTDFNIEENFPEKDLEKALNAFADGKGSNVLTVTCASRETFDAAPSRPEKFDLLRARMGGWTEFFTSMFPESQEQHRRRPMSSPNAAD